MYRAGVTLVQAYCGKMSKGMGKKRDSEGDVEAPFLDGSHKSVIRIRILQRHVRFFAAETGTMEHRGLDFASLLLDNLANNFLFLVALLPKDSNLFRFCLLIQQGYLDLSCPTRGSTGPYNLPLCLLGAKFLLRPFAFEGVYTLKSIGLTCVIL